ASLPAALPIWGAERAGRVATGLAVALLVAGGLLPLAWVLRASLAPEAELFAAPSLLARGLTLEHYRTLLAERAFWQPVRTSLVVAAATTALALLLGAMAAYAVARLHFRGKAVVLAAVLAVGMFPQISILG